MPSDNLMTVFREGGSKCGTGKGKESFKRQTQSGIIVDQIGWPILIKGKAIDYAKHIAPLIDESDFKVHKETIESLGFDLFIKPVVVGTSKHIRVRPRFNEWTTKGTITVLDPTITKAVLKQILETAGLFVGICDWRPSAPKSPGSFGRFTPTIKELK